MNMDVFSRIVLREMTHYSFVSPATAFEYQIIDVKNLNDVSASELIHMHDLLDPAQDDQAYSTQLNGDSYAWMSLDAYISHKCADVFSGNR